MKKKFILFADDEANSNRQIFFKILLGKNYEILIENEFKNQKIENFVSSRPLSLLILDLCFEKDNKKRHGEEILENIRNFDPLLPVIILTGAIKNEDEIISGYGHPPKRAWYFSKGKLDDNQEAFKRLVERLVNEFHTCSDYYKDSIEIDENQKILLNIGSREYFISKAKLILKNSCFTFENELIKKKSIDEIENISFLFIDVDRLHNLNEAFGYNNVNKIIKNFTDLLGQWFSGKKGKELDYFEIGRYFRERGDEIVILLKPKNSNNGYFIFNALINYINDETTQKVIFKEILSEDFLLKRNIKFSFSGGLVNYPKDLSSQSIKKLSDFLVETDIKFVPFDEILKELSHKAIKLKDNAKALGRNQICPYSLEIEKFKIAGIYHKDNSDLVIEFIKKTFDDTTFNLQFYDYDSYLQNHLSKPNVFIIFTQFTDEGTSIPTLKSIENVLGNLPKEVPKYLVTNEQIKKELLEKVKDASIKTIEGDFRTVNDLSSAKKKSKRELYNLVTNQLKILSEIKFGKKYYPLLSVQKYFSYHFAQLKNDMILYDKNSEYKDYKLDEEWVKKVYETLNIKSEEEIWINNRKNLKTGKDKSTLVLPLVINSMEAYDFLFLESARNYIKIQNYFDGLLKGYVKLQPNKNEIINLLRNSINEEDLEIEIIERSENLVCRSPLCPPSSINSYCFYFLPTRVRMDIKFSDEIKEFSSTGKIIYHLSQDYAKNHKLINEDSPIDKFINKHKLNDLSIVTYLGSEQIGPSIYLGIITKAIGNSIYKKFNDSSLKIYDLFAGSGADVLPILDDENMTDIIVTPVDLFPSLEILNKKFPKDSRVNSVKKEDIFECCKNDKKLKSLFGFSKEEIVDFDNTIEIIIADPPHYRIPEILNSKVDGVIDFTTYLSKITKVFTIYFAHSEQEYMAEYVTKKLAQDFDYVYLIQISSELIAVSFNSIVRHLFVNLSEKLKKMFEEYGFNKDEINIKEYYLGNIIRELSNNSGKVLIIFGPSGAGKNSFIEGLKNVKPEAFLNAVSIKTRKLRESEHPRFNINVSKKIMLKLASEQAFLTPNYHEVNNQMYGKLIYSIKDAIQIGKIVLIDISADAVESASNKLCQIGVDKNNIINIFIDSDDEILKNRIKNRDHNISEKEIKKRLTAANKERNYKDKSQVILENNGINIENLYCLIDNFLKTYLGF